MRLARIRPILLNDALIHRLVRPLHRPGVHHPCLPKRPLAIKRLVEVPRVAARVAKRQPKPIRRVLRKKPSRHRPDRVINTAGLIKYHQHTIIVMHPRICIRILSTPQPPLHTPVPSPLLQILLHQLSQPLRRRNPRRTHLKPMRVQRHRQPLRNLSPSNTPQLILTVRTYYGRAANPR